MSNAVSAMEARRKFGEMLNRVALLQEEIIIERAGKRIARLSPIDNQKSAPQGKLDFRKAAGLGQQIWQTVDNNHYLQEERQQWD